MLPATQNLSSRRYEWIILFVWNVNEEHPFSIIPLQHLKSENDFPIELVTGPLSDKARRNKYKIRTIGAKNYSLFCKIEMGKNYFYRYLCCKR